MTKSRHQASVRKYLMAALVFGQTKYLENDIGFIAHLY